MLHAEDIVALARDAARYRWLRDNWWLAGTGLYHDGDALEVLDDVIDGEMEEQE